MDKLRLCVSYLGILNEMEIRLRGDDAVMWSVDLTDENARLHNTADYTTQRVSYKTIAKILIEQIETLLSEEKGKL